MEFSLSQKCESIFPAGEHFSAAKFQATSVNARDIEDYTENPQDTTQLSYLSSVLFFNSSTNEKNEG